MNSILAELQTIDCIGPLSSLTFVAVLDGDGRAGHAHQVMSYLGLVPREKSSWEKQMRGSITNAEHPQMRVLPVQAALRIQRLQKPQTARLHQWAEKIKDRRDKTIHLNPTTASTLTNNQGQQHSQGTIVKRNLRQKRNEIIEFRKALPGLKVEPK